MEKWLYVMFIERGKLYNKITKAVVERHVENIRSLDDDGKLERCGVFKGYPGVAGMVIKKKKGQYYEREIKKHVEKISNLPNGCRHRVYNPVY